MNCVPLLMALLLSVLAGATGPASANELTPLPDQFGQTGSLQDFAGQPVMAIVASTRQLRWIGKWEEAIRAEVPWLVSIRIADVTGQPPPDYAKVADILRERAPPTVPVLIDLDNRWAGQYALDTGKPCLLIFDSEHRIAASFRGRPKGDVLESVMAAVRIYFPVPDPADNQP